MKYLFLATFALLVIASVTTALFLPDARSELPVIYWVTDSNPARAEQVTLFYRWLVDNGHWREFTINSPDDATAFRRRHWSQSLQNAIRVGNSEGAALVDGHLSAADYPLRVRIPVVEVRIDTANEDDTKKIIQSVSGVGGDVIQTYSLQLLQAIGVVADVTEDARRLGYGTDHTYSAIVPDITVPDPNGNLPQYAFPCNVTANEFLVNRETFRRYGQPLPPRTWTIRDFEQRGRAFVLAANPPGKHPTVFFANTIDLGALRRSFGVDTFNESMTRCTLDDPCYVEALQTYYRWIYVDRILPSEADRSAFSTQAGFSGSAAQLFNSGNYAMIHTGRYILIQLRQFNDARKARGESPLDLGVSEPPYAELRNTTATARAAAIYAGTRHRESAVLFQAYLASEIYNMQIVRDADSLPPNPKYTRREEFLRPAEHPDEWDVHGAFADAASIAFTDTTSPFVLRTVANREQDDALQAFMNNLMSAEQAARSMANRINREIQRSLAENPRLRRMYETRMARQSEIDRLKAAGKKIPASLIDNPYHRRLYAQRGMLADVTDASMHPERP